MEFLNQNNPLTSGYSEIELEPADSKQSPFKASQTCYNCSDSMPIEVESNPMYQVVDQHSSTTHVPKETDIYTESCLKLHCSLGTLVVQTADLKVSKHIEFIYNYLIVLNYYSTSNRLETFKTLRIHVKYLAVLVPQWFEQIRNFRNTLKSSLQTTRVPVL